MNDIAGALPNSSEPPEIQLGALMEPDGPSFQRLLLQAWDDGFAVLPLDPRLPAPAIQDLLERFRPTWMIDQSGKQGLPDGIPVAGNVALVMPTSGTTGKPKGVLLTHDALAASAHAVRQRIGYDLGERWLCCLPLSHIAGISTLVRSRLAGSTPVIHNDFDPTAVAAERQTTLISLVPTTLRRLMDAGIDLSHYRAVLIGGGPVPAQLLDQAREAGTNVIESYGMTETSGGCVFDGIPLNIVSTKLDPSGRILLKGNVLFDGYHLEPTLDREVLVDGWFHTSDRGEMRNERLMVTGRLDDIIITGGENVSASEIEIILLQHPAITDVAVVALPDDEWGQIPGALIVAQGDPPTLKEIRTFVAARTQRHKAPRKIVAVEAIKKTATGKVDREEAVNQLNGYEIEEVGGLPAAT